MLSRLARHVRGVVVHDGTLIVPAISDADTIRPEIVAPPSATTENSPSWTLGRSANVKSTRALYKHDALTSLLSRITNSTQVSDPWRV